MQPSTISPIYRGDSIQLKGQVYVAQQNPGHYLVGWYTAEGQPQPPPGYVPANITGFYAWFTLKYETPDPDGNAVAQVTTGSGAIVFTLPTAGVFTVVVPAVATSTISDGRTGLVYDVQLQDLSGNIETADRGAIEVVADVTRSISQSAAVTSFPALPLQMVSLPSTASFPNFNAGALPDGSQAYIPNGASLGSYFVLLSRSTQAIDGAKCFQAAPAGRWRLLSVPLA